MWDFRSYDEKTWFRFLVLKLCFTLIVYAALHSYYDSQPFNYEYAKLNQDQMQFLNRIYIDSLANSSKVVPEKPATQHSKIDHKDIKHKLLDGVVDKKPPSIDTCSQNTLSNNAMKYLQVTFEGKLDTTQKCEIKQILCCLPPREAPSFLSTTRFRVRSYFWLVGPCVYWEVIFWAMFGVLCSLLFSMGVVGSNATTDPSNPQSTFDSSQIFGQVAKILYAPLCTLIVVLGYNFFKDQNIVDISSSKGVIAFAFIGGFYSSRLISLMDRLKDVLLPNNGSASLPMVNQMVKTATISIQLAFDPAVSKTTIDALGQVALNESSVLLKGATSGTSYTLTRNPTDPVGLFSASAIPPGIYSISAELKRDLPDNKAIDLVGQITAQLVNGTTQINVSLK